MGKTFKDISKIVFATIGSRMLGLVRDAATMAYLSIGAVSSAYTFAFTLPNLFRRLLGEGALTSALVPIFSHSLKKEGQDAAFGFINKTLSRAIVIFVAIALIGMFIAAIASVSLDSEHQRFILSANFSFILMPYMTLICLAAIFSAALNVMGSFGVPSVGPMLLNISIITGLFLGIFIFKEDMVAVTYCMCISWLVGGAIQLAIPAYFLRKKGWRFKLDFQKSNDLAELYKLFLPALMGAAVIQVNVFVSKMLALYLNDAALPALYLSSRILEFPLGVFAVSIATVFFPKLAKLNAVEDLSAYKTEYAKGMIDTMCISVPATLGIAMLAKEIMQTLFEWGIFGTTDVDICVPVLIVSVLGLPFFALATFATKGFHSAKDTKTPVKVSYYSFVLNIILSLLFMFKFGAAGLAAANVGAAILQAVLLNFYITRKFGGFAMVKEFMKIAAAAIIMAIFILLAKYTVANVFTGKMYSITACIVIIPAAAAFYFASLKLFKFKQFDEISKAIFRKKRK